MENFVSFYSTIHCHPRSIISNNLTANSGQTLYYTYFEYNKYVIFSSRGLIWSDFMVCRIFKTNEIIRKKYLIRGEERKTKKNRTVRSLPVLNIDVTNTSPRQQIRATSTPPPTIRPINYVLGNLTYNEASNSPTTTLEPIPCPLLHFHELCGTSPAQIYIHHKRRYLRYYNSDSRV